MAKVIDRSDLLPISATIDLDAHERIFRDYEGILSGHGSFSQPYLMLAEYVLASSVTEAIRRGYTKPLEIVFDEHDLFGPVMRDRYKTLL